MGCLRPQLPWGQRNNRHLPVNLQGGLSTPICARRGSGVTTRQTHVVVPPCIRSVTRQYRGRAFRHVRPRGGIITAAGTPPAEVWACSQLTAEIR